VSPFTTVQRQEVGTIRKVTPQIYTESDSVILEISVESSSVPATSVGAKYNHMLEEQHSSASPGPAAKEDSPLLAPLAPRM